MGNEEVDLVTVVKPQEKKSLLQKYDIPVEHLSYEYVNKCSNVKELERIVLILRSGEEGIFPDLIKYAENCLAKINPKSKVLRVEEPVLTRSMLEPEERKIIDEDIAKWMNEMQGREKDLEEGKTLSSNLPIPQPEIRQATVKKLSESKTKGCTKPKSIASCDYAGWDKFDADAELDRIDLQDERKQVEFKNAQRERREKYEEAKKLSKDVIVDKLTLTATELSVMAEQEKNIGNEAYRAGDYEEALIRYDSSIKINSTVNAYNNRAITNIKLQRYQDAINDCNVVLSMEYNNITALMRRGLALEKLEKNSEALNDYQTILQLEPNNKIAITAVNKLRKPSNSKKVRMKIEEEENVELIKTKTIGDATNLKEERINGSKKEIMNKKYERNAISEICFCDRAPSFSQNPKPPPHYKSSYCLSSTTNIPRKTKTLNPSKSHHSYFSNVFKTSGSYTENPKLIIEELPMEEPKLNNHRSSISVEKKLKNEVRDSLKLAENGSKINGIEIKSEKQERNTKVDKLNKQKEKNTKNSWEKSDARLKKYSGINIAQKKIDVASKYEKVEIKNETKNIKEDINSVESPYEFLHMWQSFKNDTDFSLRAKLLRSLTPEDLDIVIGNKLDGVMFSVMLRCLENHFCNPNDVHLIHRFLTAFTKLNRFSIVHLFMDSFDKKVLLKILTFVEEHKSPEDAASLRQLYKV